MRFAKKARLRDRADTTASWFAILGGLPVRLVIALGIGLSFAVAGCFSPPTSGFSCDQSLLCPPGLFCIGGQCLTEPSTDVCGDGETTGVEFCDDGNTDDGDGCSANCLSANCLVGVTHEELADVIDDLACDRAYLEPKRYETTVIVGRDFEIIGAGSSVTTIDGAARDSVIENDAILRIVGLTLVNGANPRGGGVHNSGTLTLENVNVSGNSSTELGGGIYHDGPSLTIIDSIIENNRAQRNGGLAYGGGIYSLSTVTVSNTRFEGNLASSRGDVTEAHGGAGYFLDASLTLTDCVVRNNNARAEGYSVRATGGAFSIEGGTATLERTALEENIATAVTGDAPPPADRQANSCSGGAVRLVQSASVTLIDSSGLSNEVTCERAFGGFARAASAELHILGGELRGNTATAASDVDTIEPDALGGAIALGSTSTVTITDASIRLNQTSVDHVQAIGGNALGGAIAMRVSSTGAAGSLTVTRATIADNTATSNVFASGGGIDVFSSSDGSGTLSVTDSTVSGNGTNAPVARAGGIALRTDDSGTSGGVLLNSTVSGNTAGGVSDGNAGGLLVRAPLSTTTASLQLSNTTVFGNNAQNQGGGLRARGVDDGDGQSTITVRLDNSILAGNSGGSGPDCATQGALSALLTNDAAYISDASGCTVLGAFDSTTPLLLGPLADNGGPTATHLPEAASPVVDAGPMGGCQDPDGATLTADQRGEVRPVGICDLGSVERQ